MCVLSGCVNAQAIEYFVSDDLSASIGDVVDKISGIERSKVFLVITSDDNGGGVVTVYSSHGLAGYMENMVDRSNRFMLVDGIRIPVLPFADLRFGVVRGESGEPVRTSLMDGYDEVHFDRFGRVQANE